MLSNQKYQCIEDFGSGLNYNRKKWNKLLEEVMENKIKKDEDIAKELQNGN